jgi:glycosyltransferase involved in cell wall biosynthesis
VSWLVVTPARNEASRLPALAGSLTRQQLGIVGLWVVVDDGSADGSAESIPSGLPFPVHIVRRDNSGGMRGGSPFAAFLAGAQEGLQLLPDAGRVLKLDADVVLADDYLAQLAAMPSDVGLVGGYLDQPGEEARPGHVRGALKAYNRVAFELLLTVQPALGYDVLDEVLLRSNGMQVVVVPTARATVSRVTGSSEGVLSGRRRAGVVSRWSGYHPAYFALRLLRYAVRRPYVVGSAVMFWSWATAGRGPYPSDLRAAQRREQVVLMRHALRASLRRIQFRRARVSASQ